MEHILSINDLPPGEYETIFYKIYITDKAEKYVIHCRELDGTTYQFYANQFLENYIKDMPQPKSFVFYSERNFKTDVKIVGETIIL